MGTIRSNVSCVAGLLQSAAMKFTLIAAVVLLALAQGSFAQEATDLEKLTQYFDLLKEKVSEVAAHLQSQQLATDVQTFMNDRRVEIEPLAAKLQEQVGSAAANVQTQ